MQNMPIAIFRGDDTDALGYQTIVGTIKTDLDLTGCKAVFRYLSFSAEFDPIPEDKKLTVIIPASETKKFPPGLGYASLRVYDAEGKLCTFSNRIMVFVATKTPMFGNEEFEVDFNVRPELEPLKIFVGPNPDDFDEYRGFLEKVIDRASAAKYGLSMLLDAIDSDLGAEDGVAATPAAVKAAYAAVIGKLTDEYYTKDETEEAIDRVAAYYITYDAAGNPFPTYADLVNAQTVYSGGSVRVPTRNDYCVVLADETHDNAEYRYIYAVAEGETTGSWQPQFPVEGVMTVDQAVTKDSQNPVASSGIWSAIWGALTAPPTGSSSLYDWVANKLSDKLDKSNGVATGLIVAFGNYGIRWGTRSSTEYALELVVRPSESSSWSAIRTFYIPQASTGNLALIEQVVGKAIEAIAPEFSILYSYKVGQLVRKDGILYICTTAHPSGTQWDASHFSANATVESALAVIRAAIPYPSTSTPNPDGTGAPGSASFGFSCGNHVHPSDSKKLNKSGGSVAKIEWVDSGKSTATLLITFANGKTLAFDYDGYSSDTVATRLWIDAQNFIKSLTSYFTAGNLVQLTQDGGIADSTIPAANVAQKGNIPYDLVAKTIDNGAVTLDDRAINAVAVSSSLASLTINFPTATSGKVRDFGLRLSVASGITTAPELVLPQGVTFENADGEVPEIGADGAATILYFTETASGVFLVKGEVVTAIS